jgi:hypothetical protein
LDELSRYWGGGTYQFRPMSRGRFAGSSRSVTLDGPTLYRGKPHPNDPEAERRRAAPAEVLPAGYGGPGGGYPPPGYPPPPGYGYPPAYPDQAPPMHGGSPELRMLGGVVERLMSRLDSLESRLQAPTYEPARAPDHMSGVLQTLKMAQQIRELLEPPRDDDDDDDDAPEAMPTDPQSLAMMMIAKKLAGDDAGDIFGGPKPPAPAPAPANGPRLIRGGEDSTPNPAPAGLNAQAILAAIQHLSPAERARLVNDVGQQLDPETLAEMAAQMQQAQAAGGES